MDLDVRTVARHLHKRECEACQPLRIELVKVATARYLQQLRVAKETTGASELRTGLCDPALPSRSDQVLLGWRLAFSRSRCLRLAHLKPPATQFY